LGRDTTSIVQPCEVIKNIFKIGSKLYKPTIDIYTGAHLFV
jgi:hypothetical protein